MKRTTESLFWFVIRVPYALILLVQFFESSSSWAQLPVAELYGVFPPGASQGTGVTVNISGDDLDEVRQLRFSHPGITAEQVTRPPNLFEKEPQIVPNQFQVRVDSRVPVGRYEVRAVGKYGITNSRIFTVSGVPELQEAEPNNSPHEAMSLELDSVVNGRSDAGADVDYFDLQLLRGDCITIECQGEQIDSRIDGNLTLLGPDGRELATCRDARGRDPLIVFTAQEDGKYLLKLHDAVFAGGGEYFYRLSISTAPLVEYVFPPAVVAGRKMPHTLFGRNLPALASDVIPTDYEKRKASVVDTYVPVSLHAEISSPLEFTSPAASFLDGLRVGWRSPQDGTHRLQAVLGVATAPLAPEKEPNNTPGEAQSIEVPREIYGQFSPARDQDWYAFHAKKGEVYWIEVISKRQGFPTDPSFVLRQVKTSEEGAAEYKDIQISDDEGANIGGAEFDTSTRDPVYRFQVPDDGEYQIMVRNRAFVGGDEYVYRLSIRLPNPDFRLVALVRQPPENPNDNNRLSHSGQAVLRKGGTTAIDVMVDRRDGFNEAVDIDVKGLPPGVQAARATIAPGDTSATMVLTASEELAPWCGDIQITGEATVGEARLVRDARCGTLVWPCRPRDRNSPPADARVSESISLGLIADEQSPFRVRTEGGGYLETCRAGKVQVSVIIDRPEGFDKDVTVTPEDLPPNVEGKAITIKGDQSTGTMEFDIKGDAWAGDVTFVLVGRAPISYRHNPQAAELAAERQKELESLLGQLKQAQTQLEAIRASAESSEAAAGESLKAAKASMSTADETVSAVASPLRDDAPVTVAAKAALAAYATVIENTEAQLESARQAKSLAEKAIAEANSTVEQAEQAVEEAKKKAEEAKKKAEPKNIDVAIVSPLVRLRVHPLPVTFASTARSHRVKQGETTTIPLKLTRLFGFADKIGVSLSAGGHDGFSSDAIDLAKDASEGTIQLNVGDSVAPGRYLLSAALKLKYGGQDLEYTRPVSVSVLPSD